jgi:hypothetical protein
MICSTWLGRSVRTASIFSNRIKDKTARRTTQTHVRKRSDVLRKPGRIGGGVATLADLSGPVRTLLRWSVSKLSRAASVNESAIDDFELERRQPSAITSDAIRRAFEDVGVMFLPQDDVQLRSDVSAAR